MDDTTQAQAGCGLETVWEWAQQQTQEQEAQPIEALAVIQW